MGIQLTIKRCIDVAGSFFGLALLSPLFLVIGCLVKLTTPGPVLFRWRVVGKDGIPFTGYKLRSMYQDAEKRKAELEAQNEMKGPVFKLTNDPRITPLGRVLRKYSLDEVPQLWSVLKGDMSLVGPRPPLESEYLRFNDWEKQKLRVKPGITCLWQVSGRNRISNFQDWVKLDLYYIDHWSLWLDFKILLRTIGVVLTGRGAS